LNLASKSQNNFKLFTEKELTALAIHERPHVFVKQCERSKHVACHQMSLVSISHATDLAAFLLPTKNIDFYLRYSKWLGPSGKVPKV